MDLQVFIGFDARERLAWEVCAASMQAHAGDYPVSVQPVGRRQLERAGYYRRPTEMRAGRRFDVISQAYCSSDFSLARFWVPWLSGRSGWALFCDCDFLWRADVRQILNHADPRYAVMVVPHKFEPSETEKMDGQVQTRYWRKNWSSLMLWNLAHAGSHRPTFRDLNAWHKHELHAFCWLADLEIGFLPEEWNWLAGKSPTLPPSPSSRGEGRGEGGEPKAVHFTEGTPDMPGYENAEFADEWRSYAVRR